MAIYYITGSAGSGKTTLLHELESRGYKTQDVDKIANWFNEKTGKFESTAPFPERNSEESATKFYETYSWEVPREEIDKLVKFATNKILFIGDSIGNEKDFANLADKVFALTIDDDTLRHRLTTRTNNDYGKNPVELQNELSWNAESVARYTAAGYIVIDGSAPTAVIADKILNLTDEN